MLLAGEAMSSPYTGVPQELHEVPSAHELVPCKDKLPTVTAVEQTLAGRIAQLAWLRPIQDCTRHGSDNINSTNRFA
jgi:hypothetical protein